MKTDEMICESFLAVVAYNSFMVFVIVFCLLSSVAFSLVFINYVKNEL